MCVCVMMMYILNQIMFFNHVTIHKYLLLELINWLLMHKHFYIVRLWFTERLGEINMSTKMWTTYSWTKRPYEALLFPRIVFGFLSCSVGGVQRRPPSGAT